MPKGQLSETVCSSFSGSLALVVMRGVRGDDYNSNSNSNNNYCYHYCYSDSYSYYYYYYHC